MTSFFPPRTNLGVEIRRSLEMFLQTYCWQQIKQVMSCIQLTITKAGAVVCIPSVSMSVLCANHYYLLPCISLCNLLISDFVQRNHAVFFSYLK